MMKTTIGIVALALCAAGCEQSEPSGAGPGQSGRTPPGGSYTYAGTAVESPTPSNLPDLPGNASDARSRNAYSNTPGTGPAHANPQATKINPMAAGNASR